MQIKQSTRAPTTEQITYKIVAGLSGWRQARVVCVCVCVSMYVREGAAGARCVCVLFVGGAGGLVRAGGCFFSSSPRPGSAPNQGAPPSNPPPNSPKGFGLSFASLEKQKDEACVPWQGRGLGDRYTELQDGNKTIALTHNSFR